jgi:hypothetical protein
MRFYYCLGVLVALVVSGLAMADPVAPRFEIYRVDLVENESAPPLENRNGDPQLRQLYATQEYVLATAVKHDSPILTEADIAEYCWATQRIKLTDQGVLRWELLGGDIVGLSGLPVQIFVDGEPQYGAMVWNPVSSMSSKLPQIWCKTLDSRIIIGSRHISAEGDTILGAAYDPQVKQVFSELGKLIEDCQLE